MLTTLVTGLFFIAALAMFAVMILAPVFFIYKVAQMLWPTGFVLAAWRFTLCCVPPTLLYLIDADTNDAQQVGLLALKGSLISCALLLPLYAIWRWRSLAK